MSKNETLDAPINCLYYLISRASLTATAVMKREFADADAGEVKPAYLGALIALWSEDGLGAAELGRRAGLEPSTMTGLIDRMERDGLVQRQADPHDRRSHRIMLTETGKKVRRPVEKIVFRTLEKGTSGMNEKEIDQTKKILTRFLANMKEEKRSHEE